jgi:hypothetical protein
MPIEFKDKKENLWLITHNETYDGFYYIIAVSEDGKQISFETLDIKEGIRTCKEEIDIQDIEENA